MSPLLDDGVDDVHDPVASEQVKLEHAGLRVAGAQFAAAVFRDNNRQLLTADGRQRVVAVRQMRLLDKGKDDIFINKFSAEATVFKAFASTAKSRYKTKKVDFQSAFNHFVTSARSVYYKTTLHSLLVHISPFLCVAVHVCISPFLSLSSSWLINLKEEGGSQDILYCTYIERERDGEKKEILHEQNKDIVKKIIYMNFHTKSL